MSDNGTNGYVLIKQGTPEWEEMKKKDAEKFEASKTTVEESKGNIQEILNKHGLTWDKRVDTLLKVSESQHGYIILSMLDKNLYVYSKLNLDDIIFNIKKGVSDSTYITSLEPTLKKSEEYEVLDSYIEELNKEILKYNNLTVSIFIANINIISEATFSPRALFRGNIVFF